MNNSIFFDQNPVIADLEVDGGTLSVDETNNRVGVGTTTPATTLDVNGDTTLDNTDIDGTLVVDGSNISLDSTSTLNIDNSNTSNGITIGTATSGVPISLGHTTSEVTVNDNLTVTGDLTVNGTTTTINSTTLTVDDKTIVIASGAADSAAADGAGISVDGASATFLYDHTGTQWEMNKPLEVTGNIATTGDIIIDDGGSLKEAGGTAAFTFDGSGNVTKIGQDTPSSGQFLKYDGAKWVADAVTGNVAGSVAADDISAGDGAINLTTTAGNITIDAQGSDTDIIFKGTDGSSDTTFLTLDGSAAGAAAFNSTVTATGFIIGSADINENDLEAIDGVTAGTVAASKVVVVNSNKDITGFRNVTLTGELDAGSLDISGDADIDGTLEADAITVGGTALNTVIAGVTVTNATNSTNATNATNATNSTNASHVLVTDNESTDEENLITFVEDATSSTGNVGLEMDGNLTYNPSSGTVTATVFKGNIDAVDGDFDGTLEADAITVGGVALNTVIAGVTVTNATTAAVATTVTISDNESTDENNAVIFAAGGDVDGGNLGLESDGDLTYNPSSGTLTATNLAGTLTTAAQTAITSVGALSSLTIDNNVTNTSADTYAAMTVDFDKTGASSSDNDLVGIFVDMDNTTATGGTNTMTGLLVTPTLTHANSSGTTLVKGLEITATGSAPGNTTTRALDLTATGADFNQGVFMKIDNGGPDIKMLSSANNADFATVATGANGELTISTTDGSGTAGHVSIDADGDITLDAASGNITFAAAGSSFGTITQDTVTFTSSNSEDPLFQIKNTTNDANGARFQLVKDKGAAAADNDIVGMIEFVGDDDNQDQTIFARVQAEVADASNNAEGGRLMFGVATHDAEMQFGLVLEDGDAEDEIDAIIGNGDNSVTTAAGFLKASNGFLIPEQKSVHIETPMLATADHTATGITTILTASADVAQGDLVYVSGNGTVAKTDADAVATMPAIGLAVAAISANAQGVILLQGMFRDDTFNFTAGNRLFASTTAGGITATVPSGSSDVAQAVGIALSDDVIYFKPDMTVVELA